MTITLHTILESDLPRWIACGWRDTGIRDYRPSLNELVALVEWRGEGAAPRPAAMEAA